MAQETETAADIGLSFGDTIYDDEGNELGTVRGLEENGFYVTFDEGLEGLSVAHVKSGLPGWAELMWRCLECGEMGELEGELPDGCRNCGADKENLYYWTED